MKKLLIPVVVLLVCAFIISGCSTTSTPTTTATPPPTAGTQATTPPPTTSTTVTTKPSTSTTAPVTSVVPPTSTTPASKIKTGGTLRVIEVTAPGAPIGAEWEGNANTYMTQQWVLERLMKEKLDGTMQPELAESWDITTTGDDPNIVLHLRKGVKFQDGSDMNAAAIKWNLDIYQKTGMFVSTTSFWKSFEVIDDYTLRIHFTQYRNTLVRSFENYFMVSPTNYNKNGIEYVRTHMVGTGPFVQTDFQRDVSMTTTKNTNYWQPGKPNLGGVQLLYVADEMTREALYRSGGAEMLNATPKVASHFQGGSDVILTRSSGTAALIPDSLNTDSPWANVKVRMAVEYAIDREAMAKAFGYGMSAAAYQLAGPTTLAYDPALEPQYRKYDVNKAKQLLTDAGYPNGFKTKLEVQSGADKDPIVAIQSYLSKIGITLTLDFPEPAAWQSIMVGPVPSNTLLYAVIGEVSNYNTTLNIFFGDPTPFYFKSMKKPDGWKDLFAKTMTTASPDPTVLKQVGDAFFNESSLIPLSYPPFVYVVAPYVMDGGLTKFGTAYSWDYANIWLNK